MSLARLCDCRCHDEFDQRIDEFEQWAVFNGKDICKLCLDGVACRRWIPYVLPERSELERQAHAAYEKAIISSLRNEPLFRGIVASDGK